MDFLLRGRDTLRVLSQLLGRHCQICTSGRSLANILAAGRRWEKTVGSRQGALPEAWVRGSGI